MQSGTTSNRLLFAAEAPRDRAQTRPESLGEIGGTKPAQEAASLSFRDVFDAINPLNHIPIISDMFASATGHTPSTFSKLAGGTLLGGPLGFVASLANVIFKDETGQSPTQAVALALGGGAPAPSARVAVAMAAPVEEVTSAPLQLASLQPSAAKKSLPTGLGNSGDAAVLDLYGASSSAHASYRKAQLLPYLREVNTSQVL